MISQSRLLIVDDEDFDRVIKLPSGKSWFYLGNNYGDFACLNNIDEIDNKKHV